MSRFSTDSGLIIVQLCVSRGMLYCVYQTHDNSKNQLKKHVNNTCRWHL